MLAGVWQNLRVEVVSGASLAALAPDWHGLSARSLEAGAFQSADFALPILKQQARASVATLRHDGQLVMAVPLIPARGYDLVPGSDFTAGSLPLVDQGLSSEAMLAFLHSRERPVLFQALPADSAFLAQLQEITPQIAVLKRWQRAALRLEGTFEGWMAENFDHKRRKELKRQRNRLAEQGELKFEILNHSSDLNRFADGLLELEAQGWKGARGTAVNASAAKAAVFQEICANLDASGALRFWQLTLNGRAVASLFGAVQGAQGWIVKIAYDETYAKFSPGVLLIIEATRALFAERGVKLVDSCAIPDHPMINRIWRDRIEMVDVLVAPVSSSALQFNLIKAGLAAHAALRARAKAAFYSVTKRKKS